MRWPRAVVLGVLLITAVLAALIIRIDIDTDPENMLPSDDPTRVRDLAHVLLG